ncbi:MAG: hypothetical protein OEW75_00430 [Cyclobacteriaceae bacterium]|nr:hypothetical protein [Cyclobacteriaceae bacterium]
MKYYLFTLIIILSYAIETNSQEISMEKYISEIFSDKEINIFLDSILSINSHEKRSKEEIKKYIYVRSLLKNRKLEKEGIYSVGLTISHITPIIVIKTKSCLFIGDYSDLKSTINQTLFISQDIKLSNEEYFEVLKEVLRMYDFVLNSQMPSIREKNP